MLATIALLGPAGLCAQDALKAFEVVKPAAPRSVRPNLRTDSPRALRYTPRDGGFAITNGAESFNRPLYGSGSAFRVDAGDRPEFGFYMPGRGGLLRLGWRSPAGSAWAHRAAHIDALYHEGGYTYTISDPSLGGATLTVEVRPLDDGEGLILRASSDRAVPGLELLWAFGGMDGAKGRRSVDIGTEGMPLPEWWKPSREHTKGNAVEAWGRSFVITGKPGRLQGTVSSAEAHNHYVDAALWDAPTPASIPGTAPTNALPPVAPIIAGGAPLTQAKAPLVLLLERKESPQKEAAPASASALQTRFEEVARRRALVASQISVSTPDPLLDASVSALALAADGVWDRASSTVQHGAVAWRVKLAGWRGAYALDALGWHDRARTHLSYWTSRQNKTPVPDADPASLPRDPKDNLSRHENALHTNGDLSGNHYDMNLVTIDALFRHLLWTGDRELARSQWPAIERHLAWERRLFRRPFGPSGLPLYEAYCCIWASDDLWYSGGGATHSTAYNYWHNLMAARLAPLAGADPKPYATEASLIREALRSELWLAPEGRYAESREWLGARLPRTHPALWTFYHAVDSEAATPTEAWQMTRYIDTELAHFPLPASGTERPYTLATSNWHPYAWSTNNVVMAESAHTALGFWQAGRRDQAWLLLKGTLLDSMWTGLCPGNAGMCTGFDVYRRESQRDFADATGTLSRAIVEGLFGLRPDALAGELTVRPGLPAAWPRASLRHPSLNFGYTREGRVETWTLATRLRAPQRLRLQVPALRDRVSSVSVNGKAATWRCLEDSVGEPRIEILAEAAPSHKVVITWRGDTPAAPPPAVSVTEAEISPPQASLSSPVAAGANAVPGTGLFLPAGYPIDFEPAKVLGIEDPQGALMSSSQAALSTVTSLPPRGATAASSLNSDSRVTLTPAKVPARVTAFSDTPVAHRTVFVRLAQGELRWLAPVALDISPERAKQPPHERLLALPFNIPPATATQAPALAPDRWERPLSTTASTRTVPLTALYNRRLRELFTENLDSPRSPFVSLAIPRQGFGSWCSPAKTFAVDDTGLRRLSGNFPLGIPLELPAKADEPNALVVSLWDNHPHSAEIPLTGKASRLVLLMTGTSTSMQSRLDTGEVIVTYEDGTQTVLPLRNPDNWWPIDQDYFTDDYAFARPATVPPRLDLATGRVRLPSAYQATGQPISGGAASYLDLALDPSRKLRSFTLRPIANEALIVLLAATLIE